MPSNESSQPKKETVQLNLSKVSEELRKTKMNKINIVLIKMISLDFQPLSILDDEGFLNFVKELQPLYKEPSRKQLTSTLLPELFEFYMKKLKAFLGEVLNVAPSTDIWTADANFAYLCVTAHFVRNGEIYSIPLITVELETEHTAENLLTTIKMICDEFEIFDKVTVVVSDNGAKHLKCRTIAEETPPSMCCSHTEFN